MLKSLLSDHYSTLTHFLPIVTQKYKGTSWAFNLNAFV